MPTVYITVPPNYAEEIVETLLENRLAACVNRFQTTSAYHWEDEIQTDEETVLLAKTSSEAYDDLVACVLDIHPHDVPCIERFDESHVFEPYAEWRDDVTEHS